MLPTCPRPDASEGSPPGERRVKIIARALRLLWAPGKPASLVRQPGKPRPWPPPRSCPAAGLGKYDSPREHRTCHSKAQVRRLGYNIQRIEICHRKVARRNQMESASGLRTERRVESIRGSRFTNVGRRAAGSLRRKYAGRRRAFPAKAVANRTRDSSRLPALGACRREWRR